MKKLFGFPFFFMLIVSCCYFSEKELFDKQQRWLTDNFYLLANILEDCGTVWMAEGLQEYLCQR